MIELEGVAHLSIAVSVDSGAGGEPLRWQQVPYVMIARRFLTAPDGAACAADSLLHKPRRHAHCLCNVWRRSAACLVGEFSPSP